MKLPAAINEKMLSRAMLGVGVYFAIVKPLLVRFNIQDSKEEKAEKERLAAAQIAVESGSSVSPYSWAAFFASAPKDVKIINNASATQFAKTIHDSWTWYNITNQYNEDKAFGVLNALKTQSEFAWVCRKFFYMYSESLLSYIKGCLTEKELADFNLKLVQKPKYKA